MEFLISKAKRCSSLEWLLLTESDPIITLSVDLKPFPHIQDMIMIEDELWCLLDGTIIVVDKKGHVVKGGLCKSDLLRNAWSMCQIHENQIAITTSYGLYLYDLSAITLKRVATGKFDCINLSCEGLIYVLLRDDERELLWLQVYGYQQKNLVFRTEVKTNVSLHEMRFTMAVCDGSIFICSSGHGKIHKVRTSGEIEILTAKRATSIAMAWFIHQWFAGMKTDSC